MGIGGERSIVLGRNSRSGCCYYDTVNRSIVVWCLFDDDDDENAVETTRGSIVVLFFLLLQKGFQPPGTLSLRRSVDGPSVGSVFVRRARNLARWQGRLVVRLCQHCGACVGPWGVLSAKLAPESLVESDIECVIGLGLLHQRDLGSLPSGGGVVHGSSPNDRFGQLGPDGARRSPLRLVVSRKTTIAPRRNQRFVQKPCFFPFQNSMVVAKVAPDVYRYGTPLVGTTTKPTTSSLDVGQH